MPGTLLLEGLRVVDATDDLGSLCGRLLSDLGADVVRLEPPGGLLDRGAGPRRAGIGLGFAYRSLGERSVTLDPTDEAQRVALHRLLDVTDVWIESWPAEFVIRHDLEPESLVERHPGLVAVSITGWGRTGPSRDDAYTEMVGLAHGGMMYRAGIPEKPPLAAPGRFASDTAAVSAAFGAVMAYFRRLRSGEGAWIDVSVVEAVANLSDWALPGYSVSGKYQHREGSGFIYPVFACADGYVRMVLPLSPREWDALLDWLGSPDELATPDFADIAYRLTHMDVVKPYIVKLFASGSMIGLSEEGQERGLAVTPLLRPGDVLDNEHVRSRDTFAPVEVEPGRRVPAFAGFVEVDGERLGFRGPVPEPGSDSLEDVIAAFDGAVTPPDRTEEPTADLPFAGLRVLDFGIGAVGVETARLFAEYGADVIKIESRTYPDFIRTVAGSLMSPQFASSSRSKRSFGVDLKTARGPDLVRELVRHADVVIENNATGVMDRLGIGAEALHDVNPGIVVVSSQLMGSRGAWSHWSGYGPNTRPVGGLTALWNHPEDEEHPPGVSTIHPDHLVGRLAALAGAAALVRREHSDIGGHVEVAQVEAVVGMLGDLLLAEALEPGSVRPVGNRDPGGRVPWGPFPCAGDDEWCVINVRDDDEWRALRAAMDEPDWMLGGALDTVDGRRAHRDEVDEGVAQWTRQHSPRELMERLQGRGVASAVVAHPADQASDPQLEARGYLRPVDQPGLGAMVMEGPAFRFVASGGSVLEPVVGPAPDLGEHTRQVARELLGLTDDDVDALVAETVLEEPPR